MTTRTVRLIALSLSLFSFILSAAESEKPITVVGHKWLRIAEDSESTFYLMLEKPIINADGTRRTWSFANLKLPKGTTDSYSSVMQEQLLDCDHAMIASTPVLLTVGENLTGKHLDVSRGKPDWQSVIPGSRGEVIFQLVCNKPPTS